MSGVKRPGRSEPPPSIAYRRNQVGGESFDLADLVHERHSPTVVESNKQSSFKSGLTSPEILSTTELVSAVGQIWNLVNHHVVSETVDRKNVFLGDLDVAEVGREIALDNDAKYICVDLRTGRNNIPIVQPSFEFLKVNQKMSMYEPCSENYACSLLWRFLKRGTISWKESWEQQGLASMGIAYELDKIYGWMKEIIPGGSKYPVNVSKIEAKKNRKKCISSDSTHPSNSLASRTADCYSHSIISKAASLSDNTMAATIGTTSSLSSDYFLGDLQDINLKGSASREPILCADYHIDSLASCVSACQNFQNDIGDDEVPENQREQPQKLVTEDISGIRIHSSSWERPLYALAKQEHAFAGAFAGIFVSLCLHPIDTIKTVIQSCHADQKSISYIGRSIVSERGKSWYKKEKMIVLMIEFSGATGLYRGITSNIASSAPISAIYAFTYESVKGSLLPLFPKGYHSFAHCIAGGSASIATSFIFTPSEHIKQQMQIGSHYSNCWSALVEIIGKGGLRSLYAGWGAVLCRNIPHSVIKFYTYESLKQLMLSSESSSAQPNTLQTLVCGGLAGSTAALFTTPFDVVKTRLQTQIPGSINQYRSVFHALQEIGKNEGLKGLYRGLTPRLVMYVSQGALFFASYEFFKRLFSLEVSQLNAIQYEEKIEDESTALPLPS